MPYIYTDQGPRDAPVLILAHGAGASMHSEFMQAMAALLVAQHLRVVRFNFAYMQQIEREGKKRLPAKMPQLMLEYQNVIDEISVTTKAPIFIGGKSMGGRVASLLMNSSPSLKVQGCVCLGYPFHPIGKPQQLRIEHLLKALNTQEPPQKPILIVQGERDSFGNSAEVSHYNLGAAVQFCWLNDADHDFIPRKASGFTQAQHLVAAAHAVAHFMRA